MSIVRYILLVFSVLTAMIIFTVWIVCDRSFNPVAIIELAFLLTNTLYILISRPTFRTSDILARASTGFALASLELQHQAQEAQAREAEAEKRRLEEAERNKYKLRVAKDVLHHLRLNAPLDRAEGTMVPQITHEARSDDRALPLQPSVRSERVGLSSQTAMML